MIWGSELALWEVKPVIWHEFKSHITRFLGTFSMRYLLGPIEICTSKLANKMRTDILVSSTTSVHIGGNSTLSCNFLLLLCNRFCLSFRRKHAELVGELSSLYRNEEKLLSEVCICRC